MHVGSTTFPVPPRYGGYFLAARPRGMHPLHYAGSYHGSFRPETPDYVIQHYSRAGDLVFDPCCGRGTAVLQAALLGRRAVGGDASPAAVALTRGKLAPHSRQATAAWLANVPAPTPCRPPPCMAPFFHPETYAELLVLRAALRRDPSPLARWVALLALSRLHGASRGYLSAPTYDTAALSPGEQRRFLARRGLSPEPRPLAPRLLAAAERLTRVPLPPWAQPLCRSARVYLGDAAQPRVEPASVDLLVTSPPYLDQIDYAREQRLRLWLLGHSAREVSARLAHHRDAEAWAAFLRRALDAWRFVLKPGAVCALDIAPLRRRGRIIPLHEIALQTALAGGWRAEAVYEQRDSRGRRFKRAAKRDRQRVSYLLILRRNP